MSHYISRRLRQKVWDRALNVCEYCLMHEDLLMFAPQVDHIISIKHGGGNDVENLAFCCIRCNRNKGTDLGSILQNQMEIIRFYNPRLDKWTDHFKIKDAEIIPITPIGRVTEKIFCFNTPERVLERKMLMDLGLFPHPTLSLYL